MREAAAPSRSCRLSWVGACPAAGSAAGGRVHLAPGVRSPPSPLSPRRALSAPRCSRVVLAHTGRAGWVAAAPPLQPKRAAGSPRTVRLPSPRLSGDAATRASLSLASRGDPLRACSPGVPGQQHHPTRSLPTVPPARTAAAGPARGPAHKAALFCGVWGKSLPLSQLVTEWLQTLTAEKAACFPFH